MVGRIVGSRRRVVRVLLDVVRDLSAYRGDYMAYRNMKQLDGPSMPQDVAGCDRGAAKDRKLSRMHASTCWWWYGKLLCFWLKCLLRTLGK